MSVKCSWQESTDEKEEQEEETGDVLLPDSGIIYKESQLWHIIRSQNGKGRWVYDLIADNDQEKLLSMMNIYQSAGSSSKSRKRGCHTLLYFVILSSWRIWHVHNSIPAIKFNERYIYQIC